MERELTPPLATGSLYTTPSTSPVQYTGSSVGEFSPGTSEASAEPASKKKKRTWKAPSVSGGFGKMQKAFGRKEKKPEVADADGPAGDSSDEAEEASAAPVTSAVSPPRSYSAAPILSPLAATSVDIHADVMPLKQKPPRDYVTFGNFLTVLLMAIIFMGIILCFMILVDPNLIYIGPMCVVLGTFTLIGKFYYTSFWWGEKGPELLQPVTDAYEKNLGGVHDPYNLVRPHYAPAMKSHPDYQTSLHGSQTMQLEMQPLYQHRTQPPQMSWGDTSYPFDSDL